MNTTINSVLQFIIKNFPAFRFFHTLRTISNSINNEYTLIFDIFFKISIDLLLRNQKDKAKEYLKKFKDNILNLIVDGMEIKTDPEKIHMEFSCKNQYTNLYNLKMTPDNIKYIFKRCKEFYENRESSIKNINSNYIVIYEVINSLYSHFESLKKDYLRIDNYIEILQLKDINKNDEKLSLGSKMFNVFYLLFWGRRSNIYLIIFLRPRVKY